MDRSDICYLIAETFSEDEIGNHIASETKSQHFCNVIETSMREKADAGQLGISSEIRVDIFAPEYGDERIVEYNSQRYAVYRTYHGKNDTLELYCQKQVGVSNV